MQFKKEWVVPASVGITSFAAGFGVGYFWFFRKANRFIKNTDAEIEELKEQTVELEFERAERAREFNHMIQEAAHVVKQFRDRGREYLEGMVEQLQYAPDDSESILLSKATHPANFKEVNPDDGALVNIFGNNTTDNWDYASELEERTPEHPYIIHRDEFFGQESGYDQTTITYYEGDDILCDEKDQPIYNPDKVVGTLIFGHGSQDPNIVYVRNDHFQAEYEVLRDSGHYQIEVLGAQIVEEGEERDIKHSRILKFRPSD